MALFLSTLRVLCNEHFHQAADDQTSSKVDCLATRLVRENEQDFVEKLLPLSAKLINEDEMPGKLFALVEETLMALVLYSEGLLLPVEVANQGLAGMTEKGVALVNVVKDSLVATVTRERDLGNILSSIDLLRFFALL